MPHRRPHPWQHDSYQTASGKPGAVQRASDYLLRVEVRDAADYERIHKEQLSRLPGVARIQSSFAIRRVIGSRG
jgi:DNA-binding Lrp family transcriptional regulator